MSSRLSLSMIVRDEEATLGRVLEDVAGMCDEIVVVDTGSLDATVELARGFGAKVFRFDWIDDFAAARNFSLAQCHEDLVVWLDADDQVPSQAREAIRRIPSEIDGRSDIDAVALPYRTDFAPDQPDLCRSSMNRMRIFRNHIGLQWQGSIHESVVVPQQRILYLDDAWVEHRPLPEQIARKANRNLSILEACVKNGDRSARNLFYLANELATHGRLDESYALFEQAIVRASGDLLYDALCGFADCAQELGREQTRREALLQAVTVNPRRAKAFILLGMVHYEKEEWAEAMPFFATATVLERPIDSPGLLLEAGYSWLPWDYLSVCANKIGNYRAAIDYAKQALFENPERDRVLSNIRLNVEGIESTLGKDRRRDQETSRG